MKILTIPNPILRTKSKPVTAIDKKLVDFINDLAQTLDKKRNPEGVGLSAPQVGKNLRIFATRLKNKQGDRILRTYINPTPTRVSPQLTLGPNPDKPFLEGCLSIPELYAPVKRHAWIKLEYFTLDPTTQSLLKHSKRFESFPARVIQHELDHLEGILFTDRAVADNLPIYQDKNGDLVEITLPQF